MFQNPTVPLAPITPDAAISAFAYLRAVQAGDIKAACEFASAEPRMPELLVDVAERIVVPVTALPDQDAGEPCEDTFALEALGRVFVTTLRTWEQSCPSTAKGIAEAIIGFSEGDPHRGPRGRRRRPAPAGGRRDGPGPRCAPRTGRCAPSASDHRVARAEDGGGARRAHRVRTTAGQIDRTVRTTAPHQVHGGGRPSITHPLDHGLIGGPNMLWQGATCQVAHLVKGSADGARIGAVRNIGCGAPRTRESVGHRQVVRTRAESTRWRPLWWGPSDGLHPVGSTQWSPSGGLH
ncbi:hypothetical protein [Streptomyces hirsutus]|uniref:hypothetical protein n=1 Tax=Streptomyces hirsutus TaxID=35620 RepID=UPI00331CBB56